MAPGNRQLSRKTAGLRATLESRSRVETGEFLAVRPDAGHVYYVIGVLALVNAICNLDKVAISVLAPLIKQELGLQDTEMGLIVGVAFSVTYAVFGVPIAYAADRSNRRNLVALALVFWSVMTSLGGVTQGFAQLLLTRMGVGMGEAGCLPASQSLICDYVAVRRRPFVFAIHNLGLVAGVMIGLIAAGLLGKAVGWRFALIILGLPGILLAGVVVTTIREPLRGAMDGQLPAEGVGMLRAITTLSRSGIYLMLVGYLVTNGFLQMGLIQWLPSFYTRIYGLDVAQVGLMLGLAVGIGAAGGMLLGGMAAHHLATDGFARPLRWAGAVIALIIPAGLLVLFAPTTGLSFLFVGIASALWSLPTGTVIAALVSVVPASMRATASTISIFFTSLLGFGLGPLAVGVASDSLVPTLGKAALQYALTLPLLAVPVMAALLLLCAGSIGRELTVKGTRT
jgi:predicted MFS family arabinose efflux permease